MSMVDVAVIPIHHTPETCRQLPVFGVRACNRTFENSSFDFKVPRKVLVLRELARTKNTTTLTDEALVSTDMRDGDRTNTVFVHRTIIKNPHFRRNAIFEANNICKVVVLPSKTFCVGHLKFRRKAYPHLMMGIHIKPWLCIVNFPSES